MFQSIFAETTATIGALEWILCMVGALVTGIIISFSYTIKNTYSKGFVATLALLPMIVCAVIMMVNGNVGTGVAVAGAFSLVRFRSAQGTAREICSIFLAMTTGLILGMGYIPLAIVFSILVCVIHVVLNVCGYGEKQANKLCKTLKVTIPEDLDYTDIFDDLFEKYLTSAELVSVRTTNMGSMFKLHYEVELKEDTNEKELLDQMRCRNGNLEIMLSRKTTEINEL